MTNLHDLLTGPSTDEIRRRAEAEVVALMRSSKNEQEWAANCDTVKAILDGQYPDFWFKAIIQSGLINEVLGPGSDEITLSTLA